MRLTSIIVLALAIAMGIVAVFGVRTMLQVNQRTAQTETAPIETTTVVVARQQLEFGTQLLPELLKEIPWASAEKPEGSFTKISEVVAGERRVALRSIAPGELVLRDRISGFGGRATLSQIIEPGKRAMTIRVNDVSGAAGFILPGDRVDVMVTVQDGDDRRDTITNILMQDIRVLAIDQVADDSQEGAIVAKAATLEVGPEDAQKIALGSTVGSLSLSLRNLTPGDEESERSEAFESRTIRFQDLGQKQASAPAPRRAPVRRAKAPAPVSSVTTMKVIRGVEASKVEVPKDSQPTTIIGAAGAPAQLLGSAYLDRGAPSAE